MRYLPVACTVFLALFFSGSLNAQPLGHPDTVKLSPRQKAELFLFKKEYDKALKSFRALLEKGENDSYVVRGLVQAYKGAEKLDEGADYIKKQLDQNPGSSTFLYGLGYANYLQGRQEDAERLLLQAIETNPRNALALNTLGAVKVMRKSFDEAARFVKKAIEVEPERLMFFHNLKNVYDKEGLPDKFRKEYEDYKKGSSPEIAAGYGKVLARALRQEGFKQYSQGQLDGAVKKFDELTKIYREINYKEGLVPGLFSLGLLLEEKKDIPAAIKYFREVLELSPKHIQARERLKALAPPD
ncbi:MAG: tetratricopeptide repeat protein [Nitrospinales bacterium]